MVLRVLFIHQLQQCSVKCRPTEINVRSSVANEDVRPRRTRRTKPSVHGRPQETRHRLLPSLSPFVPKESASHRHSLQITNTQQLTHSLLELIATRLNPISRFSSLSSWCFSNAVFASQCMHELHYSTQSVFSMLTNVGLVSGHLPIYFQQMGCDCQVIFL